MSHPNRLIVFGATGYTGREVVRAACARELHVVAHVRPGSSSAEQLVPLFESQGAVIARAAWNAPEIEALVREHDCHLAFGLLGTTKKRTRAAEPGTRSGYEGVDRDLTLMAIKALAAHDSVGRFVYLSSLGAADGGNDYLRARYEVERELRASGLDFVIARPSLITGDREESRFGERAAAALMDPSLRLLGALGFSKTKARYASMTGAQLGQALVDAAMDPQATNKVLDAAELRARIA